MLLAPMPFAAQVWTLPFLITLMPSERYARGEGCRHKLLKAADRLGTPTPARALAA